MLAAAVVIAFTQSLKAMLVVVSRQATWAIYVLPLLGLGLSVLLLYGIGLGEHRGAVPHDAPPSRTGAPWARKWRTFPSGIARSDLTGEMVAFAGEEDLFPWRLAPISAAAIFATVGLGGPMGTEAPAAFLGIAVGAALCDRGRGWRRLLRPAAVGGGAAGVSALMGIALVGAAYVLELGRRHDARLDIGRVTAALVGGIVGWRMNVAFHVSLIRLVVPKETPHSFTQALMTVLFIGALSGSIASVTGLAIDRGKAWHAHPVLRLVVGALILAGAALLLGWLAAPQATVGAGGAAILWVEGAPRNAIRVLAVALLCAVSTASAAAAGGCGGLFVPFLAVGDLGGRVFAHGFGVPDDLAGSAGAASGIAGGYRLPFTAVALVLGQGGPLLAKLCCLATVAMATLASALVASLFTSTTSRGAARPGGRSAPGIDRRS